MFQQENRTNWVKDGALTMASGIFYGATSTLTGHPMDTIKTKMQAQKSHMALNTAKGPGYLETVNKIWMKEGLIGFYRGCIPPLFGSVFFRGLQFSVYEAFQTGQ